VDWGGLSAPSVRLPAAGGPYDFVLATTGEVTPVTPSGIGDVTFDATGLVLALQPLTADGSAAAPDPVTMVCAPVAGQDTRWATVPIATGAPAAHLGMPATPGAPGAPTGTSTGPGTVLAPAAGSDGCPPPPTGTLDTRRLPRPPAGATVTTGAPIHACAYVVGYATVTKLRGAMVINDPRHHPVPASLGVNVRSVNAPGGYVEFDTVGDFRQPVSESTFLGFGIEPVTAEVSYTNSPLTITSIQAGSSAPTVTTIGYTSTLHLSGVRVNGVPLDVGPGCRSLGAEVELTGSSATGYELVGTGGPLKGTIDIGPFTGCGTGGENLNPLLTGMVSGPHNYLDMVQGSLCTAASGCRNLAVPKLPAY
jgi:hypothetical protein